MCMYILPFYQNIICSPTRRHQQCRLDVASPIFRIKDETRRCLRPHRSSAVASSPGIRHQPYELLRAHCYRYVYHPLPPSLIRNTTSDVPQSHPGLISDVCKTRFSFPRSYCLVLVSSMCFLSAANVNDIKYLGMVNALLGFGYGSVFLLFSMVCLEWFRICWYSSSLCAVKTYLFIFFR